MTFHITELRWKSGVSALSTLAPSRFHPDRNSNMHFLLRDCKFYLAQRCHNLVGVILRSLVRFRPERSFFFCFEERWPLRQRG